MSEEYVGKIIADDSLARGEREAMTWMEENDRLPNFYVHMEDACDLHKNALTDGQKVDCNGVPKIYEPDNGVYKQLIFKDGGVDLYSGKIWEEPDIFPKLLLACDVLLAGLEMIHNKGRAHCDIKPQNVLWQKGDQTLRLIDFAMMTPLNDDKFMKLSSPERWEYLVFPPEVAATSASMAWCTPSEVLRSACMPFKNLITNVQGNTGGNALAQVDTAPGLHTGTRYENMKRLLDAGVLTGAKSPLDFMRKFDTYGFGGLLFFLTHVALFKKKASLEDGYIQALFPMLDAFLNPDFRARPNITETRKLLRTLHDFLPGTESPVKAQPRGMKSTSAAHSRHRVSRGSWSADATETTAAAPDPSETQEANWYTASTPDFDGLSQPTDHAPWPFEAPASARDSTKKPETTNTHGPRSAGFRRFRLF